MRKTQTLVWATLALLFVCTVVALYQTRSRGKGAERMLTRQPEGIMGTSCLLVVRSGPDGEEQAQLALDAAEAALRTVEARMSNWIDASEISRLNAAPEGRVIELSPELAYVLHAARNAWVQSDGAFDATCRPLIELWKRASKQNRMPTPEAIREAREASQWTDFVLEDNHIMKTRATARIDLGGIAKGYGIDRALLAMQQVGVPGGMVNVGGDLRAFGMGPEGRAGWTIDVRDPFSDGLQGQFTLSAGSVCTSGDYARPVVVEGVAYSHIIDPRTGMPAEGVPSASVIAPTALEADIWATALSVLGFEGLGHLPEQVQARLLHDDGVVREKDFPSLTPVKSHAQSDTSSPHQQ